MKNTTAKPIPEWIKKRQQEQVQEAKNRSKFFKFPEGETEIEVDETKPPKEITKFNKTRYQYDIKVNDENKTLEVGTQLDTQIISALMKNINPMVVVRVGKDINTRYSIKGLD